MQKFDSSVLLLVFGFVAGLVNFAFKLHRVEIYYLSDHFVQKIDPSQGDLRINFVSFRLFQLHNFFSVCLVLEHFLHCLGHLLDISTCFCLVLLHRTHCPSNGCVHVFLYCLRLLLHKFVQTGHSFRLVMLGSQNVFLEILYF